MPHRFKSNVTTLFCCMFDLHAVQPRGAEAALTRHLNSAIWEDDTECVIALMETGAKIKLSLLMETCAKINKHRFQNHRSCDIVEAALYIEEECSMIDMLITIFTHAKDEDFADEESSSKVNARQMEMVLSTVFEFGRPVIGPDTITKKRELCSVLMKKEFALTHGALAVVSNF